MQSKRALWSPSLTVGAMCETHWPEVRARALGFELVGLRRRLGKMTFGLHKDQWRDVLLFERRSNRVGIC